MKKNLYLFIIISAAIISSCKKETHTANPVDLIKDSVYYFAKEDYLWFNQLPTYSAFNPRGFTSSSDISALQTELNALSQYAINPATNLPYEYDKYSPGDAKYSFIDGGTVSAELNGTKGDYGLNVEYYKYVNDLRIEYVYPGSPADLAGVKRGYQILSINNSTSIDYDGTGYGSGVNLTFVNNAIFNSTMVTLKLQKPDSTTISVSLNTASYSVNPVLKDTTYTTGNGHKVGYIVFNTFVSDAVADKYLDPAFAGFAAQGVTDLVVDLRYNGGGYTSTAEHLDNLIVPASKTGSLMYSLMFNSNLQTDKDPLISRNLGFQPGDFTTANNQVMFAKSGTLAVNRVFFIVSGQTASASELTINNLRPEMDVQFIGDTTYGKPVGFFAININKYQLYTPEFSTVNSANQGGYYAGFIPGTVTYPGVQDYDDVSKDFGDPAESLLAHALAYINTGSYTINRTTLRVTDSQRNLALKQSRRTLLSLRSNRFMGMIDKRTKKRSR